MRSPLIKIFGGKWYLADWIISLFPDYYDKMVYKEPYFGGGSVLIKKEPSILEIASDINENLINLWIEVVNNCDNFSEKLKLVEYKQEVFELLKNDNSPIGTFVKYRMSRGGIGKAFAWSKRLRGGQPGDVNAWENAIRNLPAIQSRISNVIFKHADFNDTIIKVEKYPALYYLDPTYLHETRKSKKVYDFEMTKEDHINLLSKICNLKPPVYILISGYDNCLYNKMLVGWKKFTKNISNHASQSKNKPIKIECVWRNF